ncbi:MAG TPA: hypothetical protein VNI52_07980 [Sphingobacteriaceae bacterium]|nr:hypothetical protein [Sphingobacteriaceae bacterium]
MKKFILLIPILFLFSCQLKEQADELQALKQCTYEVVSADSVYLANINVSEMITENGLDLISAPQLAISYMQKKMPLNALINLKVTNPGTQEAAINQFEYVVAIKNTEITKGFFDKRISIPPNGGTTIVPVRVNQDLYNLISNPVNQSAVAGFLSTKTEQKAVVTLKIKPTFAVGSEMIKYPDYVSMDKEFTNTTLLSYLRGLQSKARVIDSIGQNKDTTGVY